MMIREMSREECLQVLAGKRLARLACAHDHQPYIVPVYLAYEQSCCGEPCLYGFTTPGQKIEWMRANPLVCVEVGTVAAYDQWVCVIAIGRYEELPETPGSDGARLRAQERPQREVAEAEPADERERAWQILKAYPVWEEPGESARAARPQSNAAEPFISVYYKIRIDRVTGHEATRDGPGSIPHAPPSPAAGRWNGLRGALARMFTRKPRHTGSAS